MKVLEIFIVSASLIALSSANPRTNHATSTHEDNLRLAYQTLGVSKTEQSRREHPEVTNYEYHLRPTQQHHEDFDEELQRRGHPGSTTTHIQSFVGNQDDDTQLVRSGGTYILSNSAHIQDQQQAQLSQIRTSEARIDLPVGRRGPLYALVQNEDYQQPAAFQRGQAATETRSGPLYTDINERQEEAQIINNGNFQRILEQEEYTHPRTIQQTVEEQTQHQNIDHNRAFPNHLIARPSTKQANEHFISAGHLHRFANADNQRRQEEEAREQHEQQLQTQLVLQQQLHEQHRQQALQLHELERREKARRVNTIQTLDVQRNVGPTREVHLQQEADRSGPKFALVDYERSENQKRNNERIFYDREEVDRNRPIRIRQQVSNPTQERRGPVNSVPSVTAEVAQATADHFNFYNSVAKNLPVLSLEETDPEAAAILRARHGARLRHDGILLAEVE